MSQPIVFGEILDAAEQLDPDEQVELIAILSRRLAEKGRREVAETVEQSRRDFAAGLCQEMTADDLIREAMS